MSTIISVGQLATAFIFGAAGFSHVKSPVPLSQAVAGVGKKHRGQIPTIVVILWGILEIGLALRIFSAVLVPNGPTALSARISGMVVSSGYLIFLWYSISTGHPWCACTAHRSKVNSATLARPFLMGAVCVGSADVALNSNSGPDIAAIMLAGAALAIVGWSLPEAITIDQTSKAPEMAR